MTAAARPARATALAELSLIALARAWLERRETCRVAPSAEAGREFAKTHKEVQRRERVRPQVV